MHNVAVLLIGCIVPDKAVRSLGERTLPHHITLSSETLVHLCNICRQLISSSGMVWRFRHLPHFRRACQYTYTPLTCRNVRRPPHIPSTRPLTTQPLRNELKKHSDLLQDATSIGTTIRVAGLVRSIRRQKRVAFAHISDGTTLQPIQAILSPEQAQRVQNGAFVELTGKWTESQGKSQSYELQVATIDYVGVSDPEVSPIQKKGMTAEHLRNHLHLRLRTPQHSLLARVRAQLVSAAHDFYSGRRDPADAALFVQPPLITSSDCEGAGEVFTINPKLSYTPNTILTSATTTEAEKTQKPYFGSPKYLTVSSQLHLEAYSAELGDVWTLSPTFRAEESDTPRHLAEFYMLEAEFRCVTTVEELTHRAQRLVHFLTISLADSPAGSDLLAYQADHKFTTAAERKAIDLETRWSALSIKPWQHMTYAEAIAALQTAESSSSSGLFQHKPSYASGLQLEHERWLTSHLSEHKPLFVTNYPRALKPFYMLANDKHDDNDSSGDDPRDTVACFDLLLPHGTCELIGGSLREHRHTHLLTTMREKGLLKADPSNNPATSNLPDQDQIPDSRQSQLQWYADLRYFGSPRHGGFGMGFDRLLMYLSGVANVRDAVAFPRTWGRADC